MCYLVWHLATRFLVSRARKFNHIVTAWLGAKFVDHAVVSQQLAISDFELSPETLSRAVRGDKEALREVHLKV